MEKYYIYTLEHNNTLFYVGKTISLSTRLNKHKKECILKRTHKEKKINKILSNGEDITISIIDIVNKGEEDYWEKFWISQIKSWGFKLYNGTNGGEGGDCWSGKKHSEETKAKLREIMYKRIKEGNGIQKCPGEKNGKSKLTEDQVRELRSLRESGYSYGKLVKKYGIAKQTVANIVNRRRWKHI